jgi:hypothetical protein
MDVDYETLEIERLRSSLESQRLKLFNLIELLARLDISIEHTADGWMVIDWKLESALTFPRLSLGVSTPKLPAE